MPILSKSAGWWLKRVLQNCFCRCAFVAVLACSSTLAAAVTPVPPHLGRIAMCLQPSQQNVAGPNHPVIYNPLKVFGSHIQYSIHPEHEILTVRVPGSGEEIKLNLKEAIQEAMAEWSAAIPGLTFGEAGYYVGGVKKWYFDLDDDNPSQLKPAHALRYHVGGKNNATITFFSKGFASAARPDLYDALSAKMLAPTMRKYLEFILRYTAKHEIGHLLGFEHTPSSNAANPEDTEECASVIWLDDLPNVTVGPPLMIETQTEYFTVMRNYHGVPLTIEHINIAPQEAAYGRAMFNADCPVAPQATNTAPNARSNAYSSNSNTCPLTTIIVNKAQAAQLLLLE
jgi:hypothetical protein